jgi:hypothetical protein
MDFFSSRSPSMMGKCSFSRGVIAETIFAENRAPVSTTTGLRSTGALAVPVWWSERTEASPAKKTCLPKALASAVIFR